MLAHSWLSGFTETRVKWAIVSLERSFLCGFDFSSIRSKNCCIPTVCQTLFLARKDSWCFQTWRAPVLSVWTTVIPVTSIFHPKQLLTFFWLLPPSPPSRPKFHPFSTDTSSLLDWNLYRRHLHIHLFLLIMLEAKFCLLWSLSKMMCRFQPGQGPQEGRRKGILAKSGSGYMPVVKSRLCSLKALEIF